MQSVRSGKRFRKLALSQQRRKKLAGWRIEPPVSEPKPNTAIFPLTQEAAPPELPPAT